MPNNPKADVFAGEDSLAYRLKRRRQAMDEGRVEEASAEFRNPTSEKKKKEEYFGDDGYNYNGGYGK